MSSTVWSRIGRRLPADAALNLAVFRIVVALLFLATGEVRDAPAWASLSPSLAVAPRGWGWALALFPPNAVAARVASLAVIAGAVLGAAGLFARAAFTMLVVAALYLLALPLRNGMPYHYQHLVWFAAICAASPCADALALDVWRRRRGQPPPPRSPAYGVPLRVAWLLVGVIFFFPGLWKLRTLGLDWITSDNLRNQMYWKWASTPGFRPPFRIDRRICTFKDMAPPRTLRSLGDASSRPGLRAQAQRSNAPAAARGADGTDITVAIASRPTNLEPKVEPDDASVRGLSP